MAAGLVPVPMQRRPTDEEKAEGQKVQDMQVRTQAAALANQLISSALGRTATIDTSPEFQASLLRTTPEALLRAWHVLAHGIEDYIRGTAPGE